MAIAATPSDRVDVVEELGFYALAGQPSSSREIVREVIAGEELGPGTAFISERFNRKEAATLSGAAGVTAAVGYCPSFALSIEED